jgi:acyl-coenzyme A synthetase/AMP-(fatty) acid ligase
MLFIAIGKNDFFCKIDLRMYEVAPSILESRLLGSNNIVDAAVVGIPDKENGQVSTVVIYL